jgi:hypothetical protein
MQRPRRIMAAHSQKGKPARHGLRSATLRGGARDSAWLFQLGLSGRFPRSAVNRFVPCLVFGTWRASVNLRRICHDQAVRMQAAERGSDARRPKMRTISLRRDGADAARKAVSAAHERALGTAELDQVAAAGMAAWPPPPGRN